MIIHLLKIKPFIFNVFALKAFKEYLLILIVSKQQSILYSLNIHKK